MIDRRGLSIEIDRRIVGLESAQVCVMRGEVRWLGVISIGSFTTG